MFAGCAYDVVVLSLCDVFQIVWSVLTIVPATAVTSTCMLTVTIAVHITNDDLLVPFT